MDTKFCNKCQTAKSIDSFNKASNRKGGLQAFCRDCQKKYRDSATDRAYQREYRRDNKVKIRELNRAYVARNPGKAQEWAAKSREKHRDHHRERGQKYYQENKDKIQGKHKEYRDAHKEESKAYQAAYYQKNKEKILERENLRLKADPVARLTKTLRARLREALKINSGVKLVSVLDLVGCSVGELKKHLEAQFQEGMTWSNNTTHGWHIDHIKPCSSFDLTEEAQQKECFHFTNLQPLWAKDNLEKGKKYESI